MRVLLVQGDFTDVGTTAAVLKSAGFVADRVTDQDAAFAFLRQYDYDIVVLDRIPRDAEACGFIQSMRSRGFDTPVLLLSRSQPGEIAVKALRAGADDVMAGSFKGDEFVARIEAIIRRSNGHGQSTLQVGPMVIDINSHDVIINGQPLHLTKKEFSILQLLALRRGKVMTKPQILDYLYDGMDDPEIGIVGVYICNLRKKLTACGAGNLIETVRGCGYVMRECDMLPIAAMPNIEAIAVARGLVA